MGRHVEDTLKAIADIVHDCETETLQLKDGSLLGIIFFKHATLGFVWNGKLIYIDPLTEYADFDALPKADFILITHGHYDHLDKAAVVAAKKEGTLIFGSRSVADEYPQATLLKPGDTVSLTDGLSLDAVAAYNVSEDQLQFHPKEREDIGFVININGTRLYVAGDTEPTDEMRSLQNIHIVFLPVNQPYTMTVEQAASAAKAIGAPIFFPYHTTDTEIGRITDLLKDSAIDVRIHHMP